MQHLSTYAILSEIQRREQVRIIANMPAHASNLHSGGTELERQHQLTTQRVEAKIELLLQDASIQYHAAEKGAIDAENNLCRLRSTVVIVESEYRTQWEQLKNQLTIAASDHRSREEELVHEINAIR